jgi:hypothetical protein
LRSDENGAFSDRSTKWAFVTIVDLQRYLACYPDAAIRFRTGITVDEEPERHEWVQSVYVDFYTFMVCVQLRSYANLYYDYITGRAAMVSSPTPIE